MAEYRFGIGSKNIGVNFRRFWNGNFMGSRNCRCWRSPIGHFECGKDSKDEMELLDNQIRISVIWYFFEIFVGANLL